MEIADALKDIGLSEKESEVYLALLKLGEETASRVSEIANLNRITTYVLLKSLKEKGLCSAYEKNKTHYFKAARPENLLSLLEEKKNKIRAIMPLLKKEERKIENKPEISMFEGKKGLISMFNILLKDAENKKEVFAYGNISIAEKLIEYQSLYWRKTRLEKKIKIKAIVDTYKSFEEQAHWKEFSEVKINKKLQEINCYVFITENFVGYITLKGELIGMLIQNKEIAEKELFNFKML